MAGFDLTQRLSMWRGNRELPAVRQLVRFIDFHHESLAYHSCLSSGSSIGTSDDAHQQVVIEWVMSAETIDYLDQWVFDGDEPRAPVDGALQQLELIARTWQSFTSYATLPPWVERIAKSWKKTW